MKDNLAQRQEVSNNIAERLLKVLIDFRPVSVVTVGDVKLIAEFARGIAFDEISKAAPTE